MGSASLQNPITIQTITDFLLSILTIVLVLSVPVIVFFIIFSGFKYVTARGNPEKTKEASQALMWGVIGAVIVMGAFAIVSIVKNLVEAFKIENL